jgi:hypothetical protein
MHAYELLRPTFVQSSNRPPSFRIIFYFTWAYYFFLLVSCSDSPFTPSYSSILFVHEIFIEDLRAYLPCMALGS